MTPEGSNFQVTVNDASETVFIKDESAPAAASAPAASTSKDKGGVSDAPVKP